MKITSDVILAKLAQTFGSGRWTWVFTIVVDQHLGTLTRPLFRLTPWATDIEVGGKTYNPAPVSFRVISAAADGSTPTLEVGIDNRLRTIGSYIEKGSGFRDQLLSVGLVNLDALDEGIAGGIDGKIQTVGLSQDPEKAEVVIAAQLANLHDIVIPRQTYDPHVCQHLEFGGIVCGFIVTEDTPDHLRFCSRLYADESGCQAHGAYAATANIPVRHPARFGAQVGLGAERHIRRAS